MSYLIGIAAPRSGTSFLVEEWRRHPEIAVAREKETQFWADRENVRGVTGHRDEWEVAVAAGDDDRLEALAEVGRIETPADWRAYIDAAGEGRWRAEFTPNTMAVSEGGLRDLVDTLGGDVTFVAMLREPSARALSQIRHFADVPDWRRLDADPFVARFSDYEGMYAKLDRLGVPVVTVIMEALMGDDAAARAFWRSIGVADQPMRWADAVNCSDGAPAPRLVRRAAWARFARARAYMAERFPVCRAAWRKPGRPAMRRAA